MVLILGQKLPPAVRNGNPPSSDHPLKSMTCLPSEPSITRNVGNTLPDRRRLITVAQTLPHLHMWPAVLLPNSLHLALLGITSYSNSNSNSNSRCRADTMVNNLRTPSNNRRQTLLINSANSMSLGRRDFDFRPPISSPRLLIHGSCNSRLPRSFCLRMRR